MILIKCPHPSIYTIGIACQGIPAFKSLDSVYRFARLILHNIALITQEKTNLVKLGQVGVAQEIEKNFVKKNGLLFDFEVRK